MFERFSELGQYYFINAYLCAALIKDAVINCTEVIDWVTLNNVMERK
jgi:hypothetical protein